MACPTTNAAASEQSQTTVAAISSGLPIRPTGNLSGVFLCMKYQIPLMLKQGGGSIVNTASGAGVKGFAGQAAYTAAKHGVVGLTKSAALDYASQNIRVNAVCPGIIATPMMNRFTGGTAEAEQRVIAQEPFPSRMPSRLPADPDISTQILYAPSRPRQN